MQKEIQSISPFSNGTEAMMWMDSNCDRCVKAHKVKWPEPPPDFAASKKLVNLGMECKMKLAIDLTFVDVDIPEDIAQLVGWTEEKGWPSDCMMYSDDDNDGWKPTPRTPKDAPDCQMCLPFAINEIALTPQYEYA